MPRIIKHPELRRSEILDQAFALFLSRGYDNTSLNDLIAEAGLSKGAFYYYFPSKEALLVELTHRFALQSFTELQPVLNEPGLDPLTRLNKFLSEASRIKADRAPVTLAALGDLFRPKNRSLYERVVAASEDLFRPALTKIIAQGVTEKVFKTFDPEGVADMIQELAASTYPILAKAIDATTEEDTRSAVKAFQKRLRLYGIAIDRILGLPDGSVRMLKLRDTQTLIESLPRKKV